MVVCGDVGYREKRHGRRRVPLLGGGTRRALGAARGPAGHDVARTSGARTDEICRAGIAQGRDRAGWRSMSNVSGRHDGQNLGAERLRAGRARGVPLASSRRDRDSQSGYRRRGSVAKHCGRRSRSEARRLLFAAKRRALSDSRLGPPRHDPPQAGPRRRYRNPDPARRPRPARSAGTRGRGRGILRYGVTASGPRSNTESAAEGFRRALYPRRAIEARRRLPSVRQLVGDDVEPMDFRRLGEELRGLRHQLRRDLAVEVRLTAAFVGESIEDGEPVRPHPDREPCCGVWFVVHHLASVGQEGRNLLLLSWLGFELNIKRMPCHLALLSPRLKQDFAETMAQADFLSKGLSLRVRAYDG